jgi:hypothetical protein
MTKRIRTDEKLEEKQKKSRKELLYRLRIVTVQKAIAH